jgi:tRNA nucleotidyltransferase (CCA-adding enzyme)
MLRDVMKGLVKGLEPIAAAAGDTPVYLVGGAVRDRLLERERGDVDVAVEGDAIELARRLGGEIREHERFGTATVWLDGLEVDLARTRAEDYEHPGALPEVRPAGIEEDLRRRDFTINAMAVPLREPELVEDPFGGREDLAAGRLRILHPDSFRDDPTRALRAARYAARFGFELEADTEAALRDTNLTTVSAERVEAEARRMAAEEEWRRAFELLEEWGLVVEAPDLELMARVREVLEGPAWHGAADPITAALVAGAPAIGRYAASPGPLRDGRALAASDPGPPSRLAEAARNASPVALVIARALGADWLDRFVEEWRDVRLEIGGEDLLRAGVPQGPAVGRGLSAALAAKLDGQVRGREEELAAALAAAREGS